MLQHEYSLSEMPIRLCALVGINFKTPAFPSNFRRSSRVGGNARSWPCLNCGPRLWTRTSWSTAPDAT